MFRKLRRFTFGTCSAAFILYTSALAHRKVSFYVQVNQLDEEYKTLSQQIHAAQDTHVAQSQAIQTDIEMEGIKFNGMQRLWNDRFRRYDVALELFDAAGQYLPTLYQKILNMAKVYRDNIPAVKISEEYEFVSSKVHTLGFLLSPGEKEERLVRLLFKGDPLLQVLLQYKDVVKSSSSTLNNKFDLVTLNNDFFTLLRAVEEAAPLPTPSVHSNNSDIDIPLPQRLRDISLLGRLTEGSLQYAVRTGQSIQQSMFQPKCNAAPSIKYIDTLEDLCNAITIVEDHLFPQRTDLNNLASSEYQDEKIEAREWVRNAQSYVIQEMAKVGTETFHQCLLQALVLRAS